MMDAEVKAEDSERVVPREDGVKSLRNELDVLKKEIRDDIQRSLSGQPQLLSHAQLYPLELNR
jgi:uncharacterized protein involved in exopolysaccharide biosynthesis